MFTMTKVKDEVKQDWLLSPLDRCDRCNAEALTKVTGILGDLLFCGHHYNKNKQALDKVSFEMIELNKTEAAIPQLETAE